MIADAERVGDDGEHGIDRGTGGKEAAIDDAEIVDVVAAAVHVQRGIHRVDAWAIGAGVRRVTITIPATVARMSSSFCFNSLSSR